MWDLSIGAMLYFSTCTKTRCVKINVISVFFEQCAKMGLFKTGFRPFGEALALQGMNVRSKNRAFSKYLKYKDRSAVLNHLVGLSIIKGDGKFA